MARTSRKLYVSSAKEDLWADPDSELLACVVSTPVYERLGFKGFIHKDKFLNEPTCLHLGDIDIDKKEMNEMNKKY